MVIQRNYAKLPVAVKLLLPLMLIFFGISGVGIYSFFIGYVANRLVAETESTTNLLSENFSHRHQLLELRGKWLANQNEVIEAIASANRTTLLQTLLPIQASMQLDMITVVDNQGLVIGDLRKGEISQIPINNQAVIKAAKNGLQITDVISIGGKVPPVIVVVIPVRSQQKNLGGIIVGYTVTEELLNHSRTASSQQLLAVTNNQIAVSTLPQLRGLTWQPPSVNTPVTEVSLSNQEYFAKTVTLSTDDNNKLKLVLLNSVIPITEAGTQLVLFISGFCLIGGAIALTIGLFVTRNLTRRLQKLTNATAKLANGDLSTRITVDSQDEVGKLAQSFNQMVEQLTLRDQKINHQIEELATAFKQLQETQAQLVQSEKMSSLGQMVAGIAHEINNPTSFIHGNITHLSEYTKDILYLVGLYQKTYPEGTVEIQKTIKDIELDYLQQDLPQLIKSIEVGSDRIRQIVLSLRNFSRLDESEFKAVDIHEGINNTLLILGNRLKPSGKRPGIQIIKEYADLPPVECYPGQLNQVFMNILANGIDALEEVILSEQGRKYNKTPQIHIQSQVLDSKWIEIRIQDNGLGISEEVRTKLFDPFFTTKPIGKGTGLGLSISYQIIVEKHGGKIDCHSVPGEGTLFTISIPNKQI
ncbi:ATP-binding protein [Calothrix sp. 336/3]|uniref:ATP-binding protein n=1 Tax=Calothrix sp. 336/3 TaxID=1337936 RepID=UPI0004E3D9CA|nr:ATP-binding protein [Calothrix sp. 336/3]AKG22874.1 histidine kinase [Calothrix sp. 336/3]